MFPRDESFQRSSDDNQNILVAPGRNSTEYFIEIFGNLEVPEPCTAYFLDLLILTCIRQFAIPKSLVFPLVAFRARILVWHSPEPVESIEGVA
jgi:hypothetical protein